MKLGCLFIASLLGFLDGARKSFCCFFVSGFVGFEKYILVYICSSFSSITETCKPVCSSEHGEGLVVVVSLIFYLPCERASYFFSRFLQ